MESLITDFFQNTPLFNVILLIFSALGVIFLLGEVLVLQGIIGRIKSVYGLRKKRKAFRLPFGKTDSWKNILVFPVRTLVGTAHFSLGQIGLIYMSILAAAYVVYLLIRFAI